MDSIKGYLGKAGILVALMGVASVALSIFNYNIKLLAWVDLWGNTTGWIIRIALIIVGGALFFLFGRTEDEDITNEKTTL